MKIRIIIWLLLSGFLFSAHLWAGGRDLPPVGDEEFLQLSQSQSEYTLVKIVNPGSGRYGLLFSPEENLTGYFLLTSDFSQVRGYHGPTAIGLVLDLDGSVKSARVLKSADTADYVKRVKESDLMDQFYGICPDDGRKINAVTGATRTSVAIERSIKETLTSFHYCREFFNLTFQ